MFFPRRSHARPAPAMPVRRIEDFWVFAATAAAALLALLLETPLP